jgi:hypothetical protein
LADVYGWEYAVTESAAGGTRFEFTNVDSDASRRDSQQQQASEV